MRTKIVRLVVLAFLTTDLPVAVAAPGSQIVPSVKPHLAGTITGPKTTSRALPHTLRLQVTNVGQGKVTPT
jgi:hypothetical protein